MFLRRFISQLFLFTHHFFPSRFTVFPLFFSLYFSVIAFSPSFHPLLALSLIRLAHLHSLSLSLSLFCRPLSRAIPVALSAYRNSQSSLDLNAGREATTLFAATIVKGDDEVH